MNYLAARRKISRLSVFADNRGLNYDKFFKEGETERNTLTEFNSNNTYILNVEETKAKIAALDYIKKELSGEGNFVQ